MLAPAAAMFPSSEGLNNLICQHQTHIKLKGVDGGTGNAAERREQKEPLRCVRPQHLPPRISTLPPAPDLSDIVAVASLSTKIIISLSEFEHAALRRRMRKGGGLSADGAVVCGCRYVLLLVGGIFGLHRQEAAPII